MTTPSTEPTCKCFEEDGYRYVRDFEPDWRECEEDTGFTGVFRTKTLHAPDCHLAIKKPCSHDNLHAYLTGSYRCSACNKIFDIAQPRDSKTSGVIFPPETEKVCHELKTDPDVFDAVADGRKTFEIRKDDRYFKEGDVLILRKTLHTGIEMQQGLPLIYTGETETREVTHILRGPIYGLKKGWVILSIKNPISENKEVLVQDSEKEGKPNFDLPLQTTQPSEWSPECPTSTGGWDIRCMETNDEPSRVEIIDRKGELWVECPDIGLYPLNHYHFNLTDVTWRKAI